MSRKILFIMLSISSMFLFSGTANAVEIKSKNITLVTNGVATNYSTKAETVKEFFDQNQIYISNTDFVDKHMDSAVIDKMNIEIQRPFITRILVDGKIRVYSVKYDDTINDMLNTLKEDCGCELVCHYNKSTKMREASNAEFFSKIIKIQEHKETLPYKTRIVYSNQLHNGSEKITQCGQNGEKIITEEITVIGGQESSRIIKSEKIVSEPREQIIIRGTSKYKNVLQMNATAYTAGYESTGKRPGDRGYGITATGTRVKYGTVAVDPKVIPLGSKLYVEGYGYATALDTGSAIKGNKIDLYYDSLYAARKFGRKKLTVYVLE